jgi:hypothetical protein
MSLLPIQLSHLHREYQILTPQRKKIFDLSQRENRKEGDEALLLQVYECFP